MVTLSTPSSKIPVLEIQGLCAKSQTMTPVCMTSIYLQIDARQLRQHESNKKGSTSGNAKQVNGTNSNTPHGL